MIDKYTDNVELIDQLKPVDQGFFQRDSLELAPDLLGKAIVTHRGGITTAALITETEAYPSWDAASHLFGKDKPTPRTEIQFEDGGILYMYLIMGIHTMTSIVAGKKGEGDVVFIRSVQPIVGIDEMRSRRSYTKESLSPLTSGPGKLSVALGLRLEDNGTKVFSSDSHTMIIELPDIDKPNIRTGKRVNVGVHGSSVEDAKLAINRDWRFFISGSEYLSVPEKEG